MSNHVKWEYLTRTIDQMQEETSARKLEEMLTFYGKLGWELVTTIDVGVLSRGAVLESQPQVELFLFKRRFTKEE